MELIKGFGGAKLQEEGLGPPNPLISSSNRRHQPHGLHRIMQLILFNYFGLLSLIFRIQFNFFFICSVFFPCSFGERKKNRLMDFALY